MENLHCSSRESKGSCGWKSTYLAVGRKSDPLRTCPLPPNLAAAHLDVSVANGVRPRLFSRPSEASREHQADLSAEPSRTEAPAWLPRPHGHRRGPQGPLAPAR